MKNLYLCGQTGSMNRGCEAIVRSTVKIMREVGVENIFVCTFDEKHDREVGLDKIATLVPYPTRNFFEKANAYIRRTLWGDWTSGFLPMYKYLFEKSDSDTVIFNVGGDTYCGGFPPYISYAMNVAAEKKKIPTVLWGCNIDGRVLTSEDMKKDLRRYSYIVARDTKTVENIKNANANGNVLKVCDPAFWLDNSECELPSGFVKKNTLGINLSSLVLKDGDGKKNLVRENIKTLVMWVLENTDMSVCFIPHVCVEESLDDDFAILKEIAALCGDNPRISVVGRDKSCQELKYIISECRFFIGARTHSTIAAYSTAVPTLVLSYSEKSLGIAEDLFGTSDGFAVRYPSLSGENDLKDVFVKNIYNRENEIKKHYEEVLPDYTRTIIDAARVIAEKM